MARYPTPMSYQNELSVSDTAIPARMAAAHDWLPNSPVFWLWGTLK